mgnify:CR=1 FL=1
MVEYKSEDQLSEVLKATSDTTRRAILTTLENVVDELSVERTSDFLF